MPETVVLHVTLASLRALAVLVVERCIATSERLTGLRREADVKGVARCISVSVG